MAWWYTDDATVAEYRGLPMGRGRAL